MRKSLQVVRERCPKCGWYKAFTSLSATATTLSGYKCCKCGFRFAGDIFG